MLSFPCSTRKPFKTPYVSKNIFKTTVITADGSNIGSKCKRNKTGTILHFCLFKYLIDNAVDSASIKRSGIDVREKKVIFLIDNWNDSDKNNFLYS
jgi:hypothetical protein